MVFKRRDKRPVWKAVGGFFWPKGGWGRAALYVKHRLRRLPDPPHRIARGIFAGVFVSFTPFFGFHFFAAAFVAWVMRGNILASLLATFFGNPLTFLAIATISLQTGHFMLGKGGTLPEESHRSLGGKFIDAGNDFKQNLFALFNDDVAHWSKLHVFYDDVFFPYMIGGIIPGLIAGIACYYFSLPLLIVYQNRRKKRLKKKWDELKRKAALKDADRSDVDQEPEG
ncbi:DUF2062 domain-containing protein [Roseovarius pelagicus]|uniref:DUF2062 domain-containing protein n=1 Tax=Roseovarius pelagicus TaxID=2980108 RepID=A0ABY6DEA8_9RHOB|nr:DUF2062 domain-containing protein [Roseovarius pelagicus]UXX84492.1 DUF2062 domain-containing protein [Roseovarius pelagicus]